MTLYFDSIIHNPNSHAINTHMAWHSQASCLAVASYSEEKGGVVNVYTGEVCRQLSVSIVISLFCSIEVANSMCISL